MLETAIFCRQQCSQWHLEKQATDNIVFDVLANRQSQQQIGRWFTGGQEAGFRYARLQCCGQQSFRLQIRRCVGAACHGLPDPIKNTQDGTVNCEFLLQQSSNLATPGRRIICNIDNQLIAGQQLGSCQQAFQLQLNILAGELAARSKQGMAVLGEQMARDKISRQRHNHAK